MLCELEPHFTKRVVDFYGVDMISTHPNGTKVLLDCGRPIFQMKKGKGKMMIRHPSDWELIAIKEFCNQNGIPLSGVKISEMRKLFCSDKELCESITI